MNERDRQELIQILSSYETRSNKDILTLMRIAFNAGKETYRPDCSQDNSFASFDEFMQWIKRELLEL